MEELTCSESGSSPSAPLIVTLCAIVDASVSNISLHDHHCCSTSSSASGYRPSPYRICLFATMKASHWIPRDILIETCYDKNQAWHYQGQKSLFYARKDTSSMSNTDQRTIDTALVKPSNRVTLICWKLRLRLGVQKIMKALPHPPSIISSIARSTRSRFSSTVFFSTAFLQYPCHIQRLNSAARLCKVLVPRACIISDERVASQCSKKFQTSITRSPHSKLLEMRLNMDLRSSGLRGDRHLPVHTHGYNYNLGNSW